LVKNGFNKVNVYGLLLKSIILRPMKTIFSKVSRSGMAAVFFIGAVSFLASCSKPEAPEYLGFRDFAVHSFSMDSSLLYTKLAFFNPNTYSMELTRGDVNVFLDDKLANHYVMDSTISIPRRDTFYVPLNLKLSPKMLIGSALHMLMNDNKIKVRLAGSIRVKRSGVSFNIPINYEVMQSLQ
jgi:hypothetical protein